MIDKENDNALAGVKAPVAARRKGLFRRLLSEKNGTSAIEFSILALPFLIIVFASLETFAAFTGEQLLANATDTMARKVRTGEITFGQGSAATNKSPEEFRKLFCDEISIMLKCDAEKLYLDVRSFADFSKIPTTIPRKGSATNGDLDTTGFAFSPGGPTTVNIVRAYYRWSVTADLVRPYVTNLRPAGSSMPSDYLMVATAAFRNENY
ncbi:pilus assembly protein [Rhizobium sp. 32-5/1]|uniref:TadE/TadG family type IV pilus assembly protein n=1 Tax=Rhizobium sp. 32-5/1 TaxID=3019602 RepID=UPI00240CEAE4|nr:TadE/TadG family type IV pilus assembly protein [Rhizobium sp. 32-5/1]WEZ84859.1 pilus assembly protein [Rhizobium sp. 32-5/1]